MKTTLTLIAMALFAGCASRPIDPDHYPYGMTEKAYSRVSDKDWLEMTGKPKL